MTQHFAPQSDEVALAGRRAPAAPLEALAGLVEQLAVVVGQLSDDQYTCPHVGWQSGSIGGHVRHCLDHIETLLSGVPGGQINYDARQRGTQIECDRRAALAHCEHLQRQLLLCGETPLERGVQVCTLFGPGQAPLRVNSTFGRELAFVHSHTIHHQAMIASLVRALGGPVPEYFGYAPSTIGYLATANQR